MHADVFDHGGRSQTINAFSRRDPATDFSCGDVDCGDLDHVFPQLLEGAWERIPVKLVTGPRHHDEVDLAQERVRLTPGWQAVEHVGTYEPVHLMATRSLELASGVNCVTFLRAAHLYIVDCKQVVA